MTTSKSKTLGIVSLVLSIFNLVLIVSFLLKDVNLFPDWLQSTFRYMSLYLFKVTRVIYAIILLAIYVIIGVVAITLGILSRKNAKMHGQSKRYYLVGIILSSISLCVSVIFLVLGIIFMFWLPVHPMI